MRLTDTLYAYTEGHAGDDGPLYRDLGKLYPICSQIKSLNLCIRTDCKAIARLDTDLLGHIPDLKERLERAGKKLKSPSGWYYKLEYQIVMSFNNVIEFKLMYDGMFRCDKVSTQTRLTTYLGQIVGSVPIEYVDLASQEGRSV
jgi:hypothetical protein